MTYNNHGHNRSNHETKVNLHVREHNEPPIPRSGFKLASALGASDTTSWVFSSDADSKEETVGGEGGKETANAAAGTIRASTEGGEKEDDDGGDEDGPFPREVIGGVTEEKHANHSANEGDRADIGLGGGFGVLVRVDGGQDGVHASDDLHSRSAHSHAISRGLR